MAIGKRDSMRPISAIRSTVSICGAAAMLIALSAAIFAQAQPQQPPAGQGRSQDRGRPQDTEVWEPVPKVVTPGRSRFRAAFRRHRFVRWQEPGRVGEHAR